MGRDECVYSAGMRKEGVECGAAGRISNWEFVLTVWHIDVRQIRKRQVGTAQVALSLGSSMRCTRTAASLSSPPPPFLSPFLSPRHAIVHLYDLST